MVNSEARKRTSLEVYIYFSERQIVLKYSQDTNLIMGLLIVTLSIYD